MADYTDIKEALTRLVVDAWASGKNILDPEDREMLVKYHLGQITRQPVSSKE